MKRTVKIVALMMLFAMALTALVSCGRPSGTYLTAAGDAMYVFDGDEFIYTFSDTELRGTYEIIGEDEDKRIILTILESATGNKPLTKLEKPEYIGGKTGATYARDEDSQGREYIVIDQTRYIKVK